MARKTQFRAWSDSGRAWYPAWPDAAEGTSECACGAIVDVMADGRVFDYRGLKIGPRRRHECASHLADELAKVTAERQTPTPPATATPKPIATVAPPPQPRATPNPQPRGVLDIG